MNFWCAIRDETLKLIETTILIPDMYYFLTVPYIAAIAIPSANEQI